VETHGTVRIGAAIGPRASDQMSLSKRHLEILEQALFDNCEIGGSRWRAVIIETDGGKAALLRAVRDDVHQFRPEAQRSEHVGFDKACAREIRLPAERAVQLSGVPYGLMNGQEQIARINDDIAQSRGRRLCAQLLPGVGCACARFIDKAASRHIVPTRAARGRQTVARGEAARSFVHGGDLELRMHAGAALQNATAVAVRKEPVLARRHEGREREISTRVASRGVHGKQKLGLYASVDVEWINAERHGPLRSMQGRVSTTIGRS